jgi:hypothetical protein
MKCNIFFRKSRKPKYYKMIQFCIVNKTYLTSSYDWSLGLCMTTRLNSLSENEKKKWLKKAHQIYFYRWILILIGILYRYETIYLGQLVTHFSLFSFLRRWYHWLDLDLLRQPDTKIKKNDVLVTLIIEYKIIMIWFVVTKLYKHFRPGH